jgi:hypothetical protein
MRLLHILLAEDNQGDLERLEESRRARHAAVLERISDGALRAILPDAT